MKVQLFATYRDIAKTKVIDIPINNQSPTIYNLLNELIEIVPSFDEELFDQARQLKPHVHVFVNGRNIIHLQGLETSFNLTDEIALIPPVGGG